MDNLTIIMGFQEIFDVSRGMHITAGISSLLSGFIAVLAVKGSSIHIRAGQVFFWSMQTVIVFALINSLGKGNDFLTFVALFTFYLVISGLRYLKIASDDGAITPKKLDYFWLYYGLIVSTIMIVLSLYEFIFMNQFMWVVVGVFGILMLQFVRIDFRFLKHKKIYNSNLNRIQLHLIRMSSGFIASITALMVVNSSHFLPDNAGIIGIAPWILPGIIGGILINRAVKKYI